MTQLHPSLSVIEDAYANWLGEPREQAMEPESPSGSTHSAEAPSALDQAHAPPSWLADAIRRHVATRPEARTPACGDIALFNPGECASGQNDGLPLLVLLDEQRGHYWSGFLVGAHADYAGSQDLIIESSLLIEHQDPVPMAAMVQTWNRVHLPIDATVPVIHRVTPEAMAAVRALSLSGFDSENSPAPGRMQLRRIAGHTVVTGTPYGKHDPRDGYLLLSRALAQTLSEPRLERNDRELGDGEAGD
ncbi:hypothetical protein [Wenzhouxiangella marina]|uniref:Uncharacterized protein n=1 Tax=Wenzhouxiangella marina TaxID=1579979 RepID=A0A0K0XUS0_9GAMM|nr:hypothetical protein [Wenzhouxiangella marina]AKS41372.1 hypothetical protein WM2015_995 [Wenzhouxiangella marina]MBB6086874.1 hypothetical protein [Wenzhouxiangella marina]